MNPQNTSFEQQSNNPQPSSAHPNQQGLINNSFTQPTYDPRLSYQKVNRRGLLLTVIAIALPLFLITYYLVSFYNSGKPYDLGSNIKYAKTTQSHGCPILCDSSGVTTSYYYVTTMPYDVPAEGWLDQLASPNNKALFGQITTSLKMYGFTVNPKDKDATGGLPGFINQKGNYLNVGIGPNSNFYGPDAIPSSAIQKYCSNICNVVELTYFH